jgi:hypothetical protein
MVPAGTFAPSKKEMASPVNGKYRRSVISLMISFDKVIKLIFDDETGRRIGQAPWFTEICFFLTVTYFPVILFSDGLFRKQGDNAP